MIADCCDVGGFFGAGQTTEKLALLLPVWVRTRPPAHGRPAMPQPQAYWLAGSGRWTVLVGFRLEERGLTAGCAQVVGSEAGVIR